MEDKSESDREFEKTLEEPKKLLGIADLMRLEARRIERTKQLNNKFRSRYKKTIITTNRSSA